MLSEDELQDLVNDIESERVERTVSTHDEAKFSEAICAFSNDLPGRGLPGYLLIGVHDNGRPSGLRVTDKLLKDLGGLRANGKILPPPTMSVFRGTLQGGRHEVVVVEVRPSDMPPVRYDGRVWIRVGPRKAVASEAEERLLSERRASSLARTFDARPCRGSSLADLSVDLFKLTYLPNAIAPEVLEENHRDLREQLASLRFYDAKSDCPTHAGLLLFSQRALDYMPGAYVQFVRYAGAELDSEVVADKAISGDLLSVLRQLDELLPLHINSRPVPVTALRERAVADYPLRALRELVMNAVMHRSYEATGPVRIDWFSDRIEVQNPGGLYGEARPENFPSQTAYRNPVLAEAMKVLGYVNRFGRGVAVARAELERNGNPAPDFSLDDPLRVLVTVRGRG